MPALKRFGGWGFWLGVMLLGWLWGGGTAAAQSETAVHAVLFYSPTCPHCHYVMTEVLPPLKAKFGEKLAILEVDTTTAAGGDLYLAAVQLYTIPRPRQGVPALVVGDRVLVGSDEIEQLLPPLLESAAAAGGVPWPTLPKLADYASATGAVAESAAAPVSGMWLAWFVLFGLAAVLGRAGWQQLRLAPTLPRRKRQSMALLSPVPAWLIPTLALAGLAISAYLTYVDLTQAEAFCGPFGACSTVQTSSYAHIGPVPVAALGLLFYLLVLAGWAGTVNMTAARQIAATRFLFALALGGVLFSVYLTGLEIFVLAAVCSWCLASALVAGGLLISTSQMLRSQRTQSSKV